MFCDDLMITFCYAFENYPLHEVFNYIIAYQDKSTIDNAIIYRYQTLVFEAKQK